MNAKPWSTRFARHLAIWVAVCALLLKAAVPLLASASAQAQGVAVAEVCTVYGVATVPVDGSQPATDHGMAHHGDHCALNALVALATPEAQALAVHPAGHAAAPPVSHPSTQAPDACADWVARLKHGPPTAA